MAGDAHRARRSEAADRAVLGGAGGRGAGGQARAAGPARRDRPFRWQCRSAICAPSCAAIDYAANVKNSLHRSLRRCKVYLTFSEALLMWTVPTSVGRLLLRWQSLALLACFSARRAAGGAWTSAPTGAAVFICALWLGSLLSREARTRSFPTRGRISERRAWVGLRVHRADPAGFRRIPGPLSHLDDIRRSRCESAVPAFQVELVVLFIAWVVISSVLRTRRGGGRKLDERDLRCARARIAPATGRSRRSSSACVAVLHRFPRQRLAWWLRPLIVANVLMGLLIVKSLVEASRSRGAVRAGTPVSETRVRNQIRALAPRAWRSRRSNLRGMRRHASDHHRARSGQIFAIARTRVRARARARTRPRRSVSVTKKKNSDARTASRSFGLRFAS